MTQSIAEEVADEITGEVADTEVRDNKVIANFKRLNRNIGINVFDSKKSADEDSNRTHYKTKIETMEDPNKGIYWINCIQISKNSFVLIDNRPFRGKINIDSSQSIKIKQYIISNISDGNMAIKSAREKVKIGLKKNELIRGLRAAISLPAIRKALDVLPNSWNRSPRRELRLTTVGLAFLSYTRKDKQVRDRRREAQTIASNWLNIPNKRIRRQSAGKIWDKEPDENYQEDFFEPILEQIDRNWDFRRIFDWVDPERQPNPQDMLSEEMFEGKVPKIVEEKTATSSNWKQSGPVFSSSESGDVGAPKSYSEGLHYPNRENLVEKIDAALRADNHLILTGPPGAGKTELAQAICEHYRGGGDNDTYQIATATGDWSTFDTVGGYRQKRDGDGLRFTPGLFLERFRTDDDGVAVNEWLVVDELNRANIDEAFGSLFSVLTGETVTLPFFVDGDGDDLDEQRVEVHGDPEDGAPLEPHRYYVPDDWRLIATMNSVDKASLYRMSYAFMRRFAFVNVPVPTADDIDPELVGEYLGCWDIDPGSYDTSDVDLSEYESFERKLHEDLTVIWIAALEQGAEFGPGVIKDVVEHALTELQTTDSLGYDQAIASHLLPQFEGQKDGEVESLFKILEHGSSEWFDNALGEIEDSSDTTVSRQFAKSHLGTNLGDQDDG